MLLKNWKKRSINLIAIFMIAVTASLVLGCSDSSGEKDELTQANSSSSKVENKTSKSLEQNIKVKESKKAEEKPIPKKEVITGYDDTKNILNQDGYCTVTIDNTRNDMPVYVRIWECGTNIPVRAFFIDKGNSFTAEKMTPGTYEVRYKELYENNLPSYGDKSEPFTLEQRETFNGIQYSTYSLTLYKVSNGNTTTQRISADDV